MIETCWAAILAATLLVADGDGPTKTVIIPLPLYSTLPNEGSTYGAMPVFLKVAADTGETQQIIAPSVSWNKVVKLTGTFRGYRYPSATRSVSLIVSASLKVNRTLIFDFLESTRRQGALTTAVNVTGKQNIFYRFFGLGPFTTPADESSYTRLFARGFVREGLNARPWLNLGVVLELRADEPRAIGVPGLPLSRTLYPHVPGMSGAAIADQGLSIVVDTRDHGDYSSRGFASELKGTVSEGLVGSDSFLRLVSITRCLVPETDWLHAAARLDVERVFGKSVPFFYQSTLGGDTLLRGFTDGRFVDRGAWTVDLEERMRVLRTHFFHVVSDWRVDLFTSVGQVYDGPGDLFSKVRKSFGVGFRAWVQPNILGRIDVAYGGEGLKAYVVLGYPM